MIFLIIIMTIAGYVVNATMYGGFIRLEASEDQDLRHWFVLLLVPWLLFAVFMLSLIPKTIRVLIDEGKRVFNRTK